jgi:hypothetical protein
MGGLHLQTGGVCVIGDESIALLWLEIDAYQLIDLHL